MLTDDHSEIGMNAVSTEDDDELEQKSDTAPEESNTLPDEPSEATKQIVDKMR